MYNALWVGSVGAMAPHPPLSRGPLRLSAVVCCMPVRPGAQSGCFSTRQSLPAMMLMIAAEKLKSAPILAAS